MMLVIALPTWKSPLVRRVLKTCSVYEKIMTVQKVQLAPHRFQVFFPPASYLWLISFLSFHFSFDNSNFKDLAGDLHNFPPPTSSVLSTYSVFLLASNSRLFILLISHKLNSCFPLHPCSSPCSQRGDPWGWGGGWGGECVTHMSITFLSFLSPHLGVSLPLLFSSVNPNPLTIKK